MTPVPRAPVAPDLAPYRARLEAAEAELEAAKEAFINANMLVFLAGLTETQRAAIRADLAHTQARRKENDDFFWLSDIGLIAWKNMDYKWQWTERGRLARRLLGVQ